MASPFTNVQMYLNVNYADRAAAKWRGAWWDAYEEKWFVPTGLDINLFKCWWPQTGKVDTKTKRRNAARLKKIKKAARVEEIRQEQKARAAAARALRQQQVQEQLQRDQATNRYQGTIPQYAPEEIPWND